MVVVETVTRESLVLMSRIWGYDEYDYRLGLDLVIGPMAEDESRTNSINEPGSGSKDVEEEREGSPWLQLGLGGYMAGSELKLDPVQPTAASSTGLVELELLPSTNSSAYVTAFQPPPPPIATNSVSAPLFLQNPRTSFDFPRSEITWGYRPNPWNTIAASPSSSSVPQGPYYWQPFQHQNMGLAGPSSDVRVIDAPRRPHTGIWFVLQASQNQEKEPFLHQIPKSYLRIKDGRMTVRLLMKYLVNKLRLNSESEIEIRCRGQQLVPFLTLQHVRDNIWRTRDAVTLLQDSSTTDHVMILHYGRIA